MLFSMPAAPFYIPTSKAQGFLIPLCNRSSPGNAGSPTGRWVGLGEMLAEIVQQLLSEECVGWGSDAGPLGRHRGSLSCRHPHPWKPSPGFSPLALTFPDPALPGHLRPGQRA